MLSPETDRRPGDRAGHGLTAPDLGQLRAVLSEGGQRLGAHPPSQLWSIGCDGAVVWRMPSDVSEASSSAMSVWKPLYPPIQILFSAVNGSLWASTNAGVRR